MAYLKINNFENNLYYVINNVRISNSNLLNGCLYTNTDNTWEYPTIKLVLAIYNYKRKNNNQDVNTPILTYKNPDCVIFLNDSNNPEYFIAFFLFLFSFNTKSQIFATNFSGKYKILLEL